MSKPDWVADSIFYQIFPDRFFNGDSNNDPPNIKPWNSSPTNKAFFGGDLIGIIRKFDYLLDLGVNAIYLNPIFQSSSNHRYNTYDYFKIDPKLGDLDDFIQLLDVAHQNSVHIILDGVFNHCGRGFFAFDDILENSDDSPYKDWFLPKSYPLDAYSSDTEPNYDAWWQIKSLPKFNTNNPDVRKYLFGIARYWIELGADGWRLDVPNEIDDLDFWQEFCYEVKSINANAYILGEIWTPDTKWVGDGLFDGLMNYPFREILTNVLTQEYPDISGLKNDFMRLGTMYPPPVNQFMYQLLGSHDTERVLTILQGDIRKLKLAYLLLFSLQGAPSIYYGDEIGLQGGKDPDCRRTFNWDRDTWNFEIYEYLKNLIQYRKEYLTLRYGKFFVLSNSNSGSTLVLSRTYGSSIIIIPMNFSASSDSIKVSLTSLNINEDSHFQDIFSKKHIHPVNGFIEFFLPPFHGTWILVTPS